MCTYRESGFHLPVTCRDCGGNIVQVNGSSHVGTEAVAIVRCLFCRHEFSMSILLRPLSRDHEAAERKRDERARAKANA